MNDRQEIDFKALCTEANMIRHNYYSTTHRVNCTVDGKTGEWDLIHIELPFSPQMEVEYMRRFGISREKLPGFYRSFSSALSNHLQINKALCNEAASGKELRSPISYKLIKVFSSGKEDAEKDRKDVYLITEPMTGLMDSPLFGASGTTLSRINALALSLLDMLEECNAAGYSLGAIEMESLYVTEQDRIKTGFFFYAAQHERDSPYALTPDARSMVAPELYEGGGQSYDTDIVMLCRLLWKLYDGQRFDGECELEYAPQYASDEVTAALVEGLESGSSAVQSLREAISDMNQRIEYGSEEDRYIIFAHPPYSVEPLPPRRTSPSKETQLPDTIGEPLLVGTADALRLAFSKYAVFSGRSSRREYWLFHLSLFVSLLIVLTGIANYTLGRAMLLLGEGSEITAHILCPEAKVPFCVAAVIFLSVLCPALAVGWRRMHDVGQSGWVSLIPGLGRILAALAGEEDSNRFGEPPNADPGGNVKKRRVQNILLPSLAVLLLTTELAILSVNCASYTEKKELFSHFSASQGLYVWNQSVVDAHGKLESEYALDAAGNIVRTQNGELRFPANRVSFYEPVTDIKLEITKQNYMLPEKSESLFLWKNDVVDLSGDSFRFDKTKNENPIPTELVLKYEIHENSILILKDKKGEEKVFTKVKCEAVSENQTKYYAFLPEVPMEEHELKLAKGKWIYDILLCCEPEGATNPELTITSLNPDQLYFAVEKETTVYAKSVKLRIGESGSTVKIVGKLEGQYSLSVCSDDGCYTDTVSLSLVPDEELLAFREAAESTPTPSPTPTPTAAPTPTPAPQPTPSTGTGSRTVYVYLTPTPAPTLKPTPEREPQPLVFSCDVTSLSLTVGEIRRIYPSESCTIFLSQHGIVSVNPNNFEVTALSAGECDIILTCTLAQLNGEKIIIHVVVSP